MSEADLAYFRERDLQALLERKARDEAAKAEAREREARLEKLRKQVQIEARQEPGRLLQPTQAHLNRLADTAPSDGGRVIARAPPRRAVPSWRVGL